MEEPDSLEDKQAILKYWTLVEFFSPYILENHLNSRQSYQKIYADDQSNIPLPWLNNEVIEENHPATPFAKGYHLYLGLFSIEETANRARHTFAKQPSQWQSINWRSCAVPNSISCFGRLTVTTHGIPLFGTLTLSTLPWAHGRLLNEKEDTISIEHYWKSVSRLLQSLREDYVPLLAVKLMKKPNQAASYLDNNTLLKLIRTLYEWAGYEPYGYPLVLIEPVSGDQTVVAKDPQIKTEQDVPILNSFYIQDLESAAVSLKHQKGKPIDYYLSQEEGKRIFLDSQEGTETILETIRPNKTPSGRWPEHLFQKQNLMQQFAINAAFDSLKMKGLFSINGPPGTGKTSLLREIIAENIVNRAEALSQFKTSQDTFVRRQTLNFENHDPITLSELHPSLLGYEMVVVSSNNTAVQNLSKELPLRSQLAPSFQNTSYLETVATKLLGLKEKEVWGLISAPLGNMDNCRHFVESIFMIKSEEKGKTRIWEWIESYNGLSFHEARDHFIAIKKRQKQLSTQLEILAFLHDQIEGHTVETYCAKELNQLENAEKECACVQKKLSQLLQEHIEIKEHLTLLEERENLWKKQRPNTLHRIFDYKTSAIWSEKLVGFENQRMEMIEELNHCKSQIKLVRQQFQQQSDRENDLIECFLDRALLFYLYQDLYQTLIEIHPTARLPKRMNEELEKEAHTHSFYQTEELNQVRSELFVAALTLHEAWFAETAQMKGAFRGNLQAISQIIQGKTATTADDMRLAWQSVFLFLPVVSSTFASIGRLFRYLEPGTLGWLLIDEAGQAIPQAAVGAIWRAQHVFSLGDPFQIEPISTIPAEVIDGMAKRKINDYTLKWAPTQVSVQNLMDRASIFGTNRTIREENHWLGSPLRVHRRCLEPMFSIANSIAYEDSMLLATENNEDISLSASCWWDIRGSTNHKQYVPDQGEALASLLIDSLTQMNQPNLYVISPFREIVKQIQHLLLEDKELYNVFEEKFPTISLRSWIKQSIGTVHTFQGKQALVVFFVLGGDKTTLSAVEWASRKPNLLNVALTRAQARFYIIGDYNLWSTWPYFDVAAKKLERRSYVSRENTTPQ